jgi:hypothetical protein
MEGDLREMREELRGIQRRLIKLEEDIDCLPGKLFIIFSVLIIFWIFH